MAYPSVHKINAAHITSYCSSIGGTPVASYIRVPFRARLAQINAVTHGIITTADCTLTVALNGTAITGTSTFTIPVASAAAGQVGSLTPSGPIYVDIDDVIKVTPSGASGSSIAATFGIALMAL